MSKRTADPPVRGRPRGRPPSIDRDAALDAAMRAFWSRGYDGVSLSDLTDAMGLSRPSLYGLFGEKEALFLRALERYGATVGAAPMAAFDAAFDPADPRPAVRAFLDTSLANNTAPDGPCGCLFGSCAGAVAPQMPKVAALLDKASSDAGARLARAFDRAVAVGSLPDRPTPEMRAVLLLDMMTAQAARARAGEGQDAIRSGLDARVDALLARGRA